jgi:CheY-like chemotaxis protein
LPLVVDASMQRPESEAHREDAANMPPLRVLLVEDDATVADVVRGLLSARGHEVVHAGHALAALREISAGDFDVGLLDLTCRA